MFEKCVCLSVCLCMCDCLCGHVHFCMCFDLFPFKFSTQSSTRNRACQRYIRGLCIFISVSDGSVCVEGLQERRMNDVDSYLSEKTYNGSRIKRCAVAKTCYWLLHQLTFCMHCSHFWLSFIPIHCLYFAGIPFSVM